MSMFDLYNRDDDFYEIYADETEAQFQSRRDRRKRKPRVHHTPKKSDAEIVASIADAEGLEGGFETTYQPARHETEWLLQSLRGFFDQSYITDVLRVVKGGKEATVYQCAAHPATGYTYLAAKVYRPRMFRNLRNDHAYRSGRSIIGVSGKGMSERDTRLQRAVAKGTAFGADLQHTSWLMHEYKALQTLHDLGGDVPQAFVPAENAILMQYIGDEYPAPTLNSVHLSPEDAQGIFTQVVRNIRLMWQAGIIHGDLSAYNILYHDSQATLIDFPQIVNPDSNPNAYTILRRDIERTFAYFQDLGVDCDADVLIGELWGDRQRGDILIADEELE